MPTYEYACKSCGKHFDVAQSFEDDPLTACPTCEGPLRKVFGNIAIAFKGSGFYKTDNRSGGRSGLPPSSSSDSDSSSGGDSSTSTSTEKAGGETKKSDSSESSSSGAAASSDSGSGSGSTKTKAPAESKSSGGDSSKGDRSRAAS
ncbi:MAG: FmdB family transcriptional regulator [Actinomycetota bacterium]|nr:FmdB family transcriptional regulator [Actinomycetota bacterium]